MPQGLKNYAFFFLGLYVGRTRMTSKQKSGTETQDEVSRVDKCVL